MENETIEETTRNMTPAQKKLFELRLKYNAGRKANKEEVLAEHERIEGNSKSIKKEQIKKQQKVKQDTQNITSQHLHETAEIAEIKAKSNKKKAKRKAAFGWDVFNQDSLYKAYKKRLVNLPVGNEQKSTTINNLNDLEAITQLSQQRVTSKDGVDRMANELEERIQSRKTFSRRRKAVEGADVDYINDQNRLFNRKAAQAYDKYTVEIRQNLERGTAL